MREGGEHLRPETGRLRTVLDPLAWPLRTRWLLQTVIKWRASHLFRVWKENRLWALSSTCDAGLSQGKWRVLCLQLLFALLAHTSFIFI